MIKSIKKTTITKWKGPIAFATEVSVTIVHSNFTRMLVQHLLKFASHFFFHRPCLCLIPLTLIIKLHATCICQPGAHGGHFVVVSLG